MTPQCLSLLRFAAAFLWADLRIADAEDRFLHALAGELGVTCPDTVRNLLAQPPDPEDVDPTRVSPALARAIRDVALRAIASDGYVDPGEMTLFDLLDELLPEDPVAGAADGEDHQPS